MKYAFLSGTVTGSAKPGKYAVLECTGWGARCHYDAAGYDINPNDPYCVSPAHKVAATYIRTERVLETFEVS